MNKIILPCLLTMLFLANCTNNKMLNDYTNENPAKLAIKVQLTDESQRIVADSICSQLISRLILFSKENNNFIIVREDMKPDFIFSLKIKDLHIVPDSLQKKNETKRNAIESKYDRINDSIEQNYKSMSAGQIAAANIAVNVAANIMLMPLGFMSVSVVTDPGPQMARPSKKESRIINSTYLISYIKFESTLENFQGKIIWQCKDKTKKLKMQYIISAKEQLAVLVRNTLLEIDGKLPFTTLK